MYLTIFLEYLFQSEVSTTRLSLKYMKRLISIKHKFNLDFDNAYIIIIAEKFDLITVSFDSDFDKIYLARTPQMN